MAKECKGFCYMWKKQPFGPRFIGNKSCRVCNSFYPVETDAGSANICFCCHTKLAIKPRRHKCGREKNYEVHRY